MFLLLTLNLINCASTRKGREAYADPQIRNPSAWIQESVAHDLAFLKGQKLNQAEIDRCWSANGPENVRVRIVNNTISYGGPFEKHPRFIDVLRRLQDLRTLGLPDVTFWTNMGDKLDPTCKSPILVMSKKKQNTHHIPFPDFEILSHKNQILSGQDITRYESDFSKKIPKLIWRGALAQEDVTRSNYLTKSRVKLMLLSDEEPSLLNVAFTGQAPAALPELTKYFKPFLPFEDVLNYKYHLWIDGNTASYTASGWRFFMNIIVMKPKSENTQWYYHLLVPDVNFVEVEEDLSDLVVKIKDLNSHPEKAESIAAKAQTFARTHLTDIENMRYLYHLIWEYSKLPRIEVQ